MIIQSIPSPPSFNQLQSSVGEYREREIILEGKNAKVSTVDDDKKGFCDVAWVEAEQV